MRNLRNELAKMRHLHIAPIALALPLGIAGMTAFRGIASGLPAELDDPNGFGWKILLAGLGLAISLVSPLLIAVLASRQVEIEHSGSGWMLSAVSGVGPGRLCRAKFAVLGLIITIATLAQSLFLIALGLAMGISAPLPVGHWVGFTIAAVVVNLAVLGFHILLSAKVENQLVCLGTAVIGVFLAVFASAMPEWLRLLTPWGYYSLATAADFVGTHLVYLDIPLPLFAALATVVTLLFILITVRFDRQEA